MATFILDTRNQKDAFVEKSLKELGHDVVRSKLPFGDVAERYDMFNCIDLKSSGGGLIELAHNICSSDHNRMKKEIENCLAVHGNITFLIFEPEIHCLEDVKYWIVPKFKHNIWKKVRYLRGVPVPKNKVKDGEIYDIKSVMVHKAGEPMTKVKAETLYKCMKTISEPDHYGKGTKVNFVFTDKNKCGKVIEDLLLNN